MADPGTAEAPGVQFTGRSAWLDPGSVRVAGVKASAVRATAVIGSSPSVAPGTSTVTVSPGTKGIEVPSARTYESTPDWVRGVSSPSVCGRVNFTTTFGPAF